MRVVLFLWAAVAIVKIGAGQECGSEIKTLRACMKAELERNFPNPEAFDKNALKQHVRQCFSSNGCSSAPEFDDDDMEEPDMGSGPFGGEGPPMDKLGACLPFKPNEATMEGVKTCAEKLVPRLKPWMQNCVGKKIGIANFAFPELPEMDGQEPGPQMALRKMLGMKKHLQSAMGALKGMRKVTGATYDPAVCPASARSAMPECLSSKLQGTPMEFVTKSGMQLAFGMREKKQQLCAARDQCIARISAGCAAQLKKVPSAMCECAQNALKLGAFKQQMAKCIAEETGQTAAPGFLQSGMGKQLMAMAGPVMANKLGELCAKVEQMGDPCDAQAYKRDIGPPPRPEMPQGGSGQGGAPNGPLARIRGLLQGGGGAGAGGSQGGGRPPLPPFLRGSG